MRVLSCILPTAVGSIEPIYREKGDFLKKTIAILAGDGIGPEVMSAAIRVLEAVSQQFGHQFELLEGLIGGAAWEIYHEHFPEQTRIVCEKADAILFGSVGGPIAEATLPKWKNCEKDSILSLRKAFGFNLNFRPAKIYPAIKEICPLKESFITDDVDILIIRELLGDIYFGEHSTKIVDGQRIAIDVAEYSEAQIAAAADAAFRAAGNRRGKVSSIDKANVLDTSKLWRQVVHEVHANYSDIVLEDILVDNCAMQIVANPSQFDVIVTSNLFGDILSDLASVLPGSLGLTPSASLNMKGFGLYEPSGGSAPDIAGKGIANPLAQILSLAMLLQHSFGLQRESDAIETAVAAVLANGYRTKDIAQNECKTIGTAEMAELIVQRIKRAV